MSRTMSKKVLREVLRDLWFEQIFTMKNIRFQAFVAFDRTMNVVTETHEHSKRTNTQTLGTDCCKIHLETASWYLISTA